MKSTGRDSVNSNPRPAVLTDFDDTAAVQNVAEMLLTKFGDPTWQDVRRRFREGEFTLNQYQEITFRNIQAGRATMQGYVKQNASLRPYFKEMWRYCQDRQVPLAVVSQGLDFYIEALLEKEGCGSVPVHAVNTRFDAQGINYEYRYAVLRAWWWTATGTRDTTSSMSVTECRTLKPRPEPIWYSPTGYWRTNANEKRSRSVHSPTSAGYSRRLKS